MGRSDTEFVDGSEERTAEVLIGVEVLTEARKSLHAILEGEERGVLVEESVVASVPLNQLIDFKEDEVGQGHIFAREEGFIAKEAHEGRQTLESLLDDGDPVVRLPAHDREAHGVLVELVLEHAHVSALLRCRA